MSSPYSFVDVFSDIRYIVIAGKHKQNILDAIQMVTKGLKVTETHMHKLAEFFSTRCRDNPPRVPIGLLLDLSTFDKQDAQVILDFYRQELSTIEANYEMQTTLLCKEIDRQKLDTEKNWATVITFASDFVSIQRKQRSIKVDIPGEETSLDLPLTREAFTAGYLLASSASLAWAHLNLWYWYFPKLRPLSAEKHEKWPMPAGSVEVPCPFEESDLLPALGNDPSAPREPISVPEQVHFAALFASYTREVPLTYHDLITRLSEFPIKANEYDKIYSHNAGQGVSRGLVDNECKVASLVSQSSLQSKTQDAHKRGDLKRKLQSEGDLYVQNVVPRFKCGHQKTLSLHLPLDNYNSCVASIQWSDITRANKLMHEKKIIQRVVMFDLDSALLDPRALRRACWMKALSVFFRLVGLVEHTRPSNKSDPNGAIRDICETVAEVYESFVYDMHDRYYKLFSYNPDISPELLPCDFRQVWNHPYAWATLLWILQLSDHDQLSSEGKVKISAMKRWKGLLEKHVSEESCDCIVCERIKNLLWQLSRSTRAVGRDLLRYLPQFAIPVSSAREAFWGVDYPCYAQAFSCIQTIRSMEDCEVYIVSEGDEDTQLNKLKCTGLDVLFPKHRVLTTGAVSATEDIERTLVRLRGYHQIALQNAAREKYFVHTENRDAVKTLIEILHVLGGKQEVGFYCAVVDAIRLNPQAPAEILHSFSRRTATGTEVSRHRMQFFMIGDRYDSDCRPPLEMFRESQTHGSDASAPIGTCRLLSGKRAREFYPPDREDHSTLYVCDTLAQCTHLLTSPSTWDQVQEILPKMNIPPVLLTVKGRKIVHRSEKQGYAEVPVVDTFRSLAWSRQSDALRNEPEAMYLVRQLERDIAVCPPKGQRDFFKAVAKQMSRWWNDKMEKDNNKRAVSFGVYK
jgi:hypothetical protein